MSDTIPVTFSLAFFEYRANFADPVFELWSAPDRALQKSLYKALLPWGITLDNVQLPAQPKNVNEWQLTFNLLRFRTSVIIGTGGLIISVNNPDWSQANLIAAIAAAALAAVKEAITTSIAAQNASLAMHLTPMGSTAKQITAPFLNVKDAATSRLGEPKYLGFSIYGERAVWVVDASAVFPDSLFLRLVRSHDGDTGIAEILKALEEDERGILSMLGLHENVSS